MTRLVNQESSIVALMGSLTAFRLMCDNLGVCNITTIDIEPNFDDSLIKIDVWMPDDEETCLAYAEIRARNMGQLDTTIKSIIGKIDRYMNKQDKQLS